MKKYELFNYKTKRTTIVKAYLISRMFRYNAFTISKLKINKHISMDFYSVKRLI